jgi:hypothetical protein
MNRRHRDSSWRSAVFRRSILALFLALTVAAAAAPARAADSEVYAGEIKITKPVIYPAIRQSASPSGGREVAVNPPPLLWPAATDNDVRYDVRLSQDPNFPAGQTIVSTSQPWALFNPHHKLATGTWYWQYAISSNAMPARSATNVFKVTSRARVFETKTAKELVAACPRHHPRLLVKAHNLATFRQRVKDLDAAVTVVSVARKRLGQQPPKEEDATPKRKARGELQAHKVTSDASKELGQRAFNVVSLLCQAYLITGEEPFGREAIRWALRVAEWDRNGISGQNNLGDAACMEAMALAYDSCHGLLSEGERRKLLKAIQTRAGHFFSFWMNRLEVVLHQEHYWGHILQRAIQAAIATLGDTPEAEQWLTYAYEVWLARAPTAGCADGGWMVGTNYNGIEGESLIAIPALFQNLTDDDLFARPFYRNNLYFLIYCQPPQGYGDGLGDAHEIEKGPRAFHLRYIEALAKRTGDPHASWYLEKSGGSKRESKKKGLDWNDLGWGKQTKRPPPADPSDLPQARAFREAGVVAMHTDLGEPRHDLFVGFRSSPWGSYGHAQADQNTFNIVVGGERLFWSSGYKMPSHDPHSLGWYKHTRGHNGILVDGKGQPYGSEAFGWIPRYLHGDRISYCVGDASRAYDAKAVADDVETIPEVKGQANLRSGQAGLTRFRRHVALLRPSTVIVYDELAADHDAEWTWLLHSMEKIRVEPEKQRLFASASGARSRVDLFGSVPLQLSVTNHFSVPAVNWRGKTNKDGEEMDYADNQWHVTAVSGRKANAMRFLAVIQVRRAGDNAEFTDTVPDASGWLQSGGWRIRAELDASKRPCLEIQNVEGTAALVMGKAAVTAGEKTYRAKLSGSSILVEKVADEWLTRESVDELPEAAK